MGKIKEILHPQDVQEKEPNKKKRAAAAAVAVVTSASMVVGGVFQSPADLLEEQNLTPQVILADDEDLTGGGDDGDDSSAAAVEEEKERSGMRAAVRQRVQRVPYALRLLVILPLWCLGWLLLTGTSALWTALLSPVLGKALAWLLLMGALLGAFLLAGKTIFPDLPWKKILNRRSMLGLILGSVALGVADIVVPLFWAEYTQVENLVRAVGVLLVFGTVTLLFARREIRRRRELAEQNRDSAPEEAPPAPPIMSRREILALADSVSRPR